MAVTVKFRGLEVVCDTVEEAEAIVAKAAKLETNSQSRAAAPPQPQRGMAEAVGRLRAESQKLLAALLGLGGQATDADLRAKLGLKDNLRLGSLIGALANEVRKHGFEREELLQKRTLPQGGYHYEIPQNAMKAIEEGLQDMRG